MSSRDLIYLSAAFGGFFVCLILEIIALRVNAKRLSALKLDVALAAAPSSTEAK